MQADAAAALGVAVGDVVMLDERVPLMIVGTWRVDDADAPRWMGDPLWTSGGNERSVGPIVADDDVWTALGITPQAKWTIAPDIDRLTPSDLGTAAAAWDALPAAFTAAGLSLPSLTGRFLLVARESQALVSALQTATPLALIVLGVIAALAVWELAGLLARTRRAESSLLWARGATVRRLATTTAVEAGIVAAAGALIGVCASAFALAPLPEGPGSAAAAGVGASLLVVAVAAGSFALRTARSIGPTGAASERRSERGRRTVAAGVLALVSAAAIISTWQLLTNGPLTLTRSGRAEIDPVSLVAPALTLAAIVLASLFAFPLLARAAEVPAARSPGPLTVLAVRGVARRATGTAVPIVMIGLAVGQLIVAAGYGASWSGAFTQSQELRFGAAVSMSGLAGGLSEADLDAATSASAVVAPVRTGDLLIGGESAAVVGVSSRAVADLALSGGGTVDPDALATALMTTSDAQLPDASTTISVAVSGTSDAGVSVWLSDSFGRLHAMALETERNADGLLGTAAMPDGAAPWTVAAVDVTPAPTTDAGAATPLIVTSIVTDAGDLDGFAATTAVFRNGLLVGAPGARGGPTAIAQDGDRVRFLPSPPAGSIVISESLADRLGTRVGAPLTLDFDGAPVQTSVAAIVPAIPGAEDPSAILIDATVVDAAHLATDAQPSAASLAWLGTTGDAGTTAAALRAALPPSVTIRAVGEGPDRVMLAAGPAALWLAALAGAALAIAGLIAVCVTQLRERRDEVIVLRALGIAPRSQAALRRRESVIVEAWAIASGAVAGGAVVLLAVATLARIAVPGANPALPTAVRLDIVAATAATALLAVALYAVIAASSAFVARSRPSGMTSPGTT